jgi:hypothetical protein
MERYWKAATVAPTGCAALDGGHSMSFASIQLDSKLSTDAPVGRNTLKRISSYFPAVAGGAKRIKCNSLTAEKMELQQQSAAEALQYWVDHQRRVPKAIKQQGAVAVCRYLEQRARASRMFVSEAESEEGILTLRRRTR